MDAVAAWLLGRIAILVLLAATAACALDFAFKRPRSRTLARHRYRVLRAHDEQTGEPIEDLEVLDVMSGATAHTTKNGAVSLAFLPEGGSLVRLRKLGFAPVTMSVPISPTDTVPLTVLMQRTSHHPTAYPMRRATAGRSRSA